VNEQPEPRIGLPPGAFHVVFPFHLAFGPDWVLTQIGV
jgi:hypothetical protein